MTRRVLSNYLPSSLCSKRICRKPFGHRGHLEHHPRPHTLFSHHRTHIGYPPPTLPLIELKIRGKAQRIIYDVPSRTVSDLASSSNIRTLPEQDLTNASEMGDQAFRGPMRPLRKLKITVFFIQNEFKKTITERVQFNKKKKRAK